MLKLNLVDNIDGASVVLQNKLPMLETCVDMPIESYDKSV